MDVPPGTGVHVEGVVVESESPDGRLEVVLPTVDGVRTEEGEPG